MNPVTRRLIALISVAMVVDTAAYATITPLLPGLAKEYGLSKAGAGFLSASYPIGTFALSIPAGALAARIGARQTVLVALSVLAVSSLVFGLATSAPVLVVARLLQGFGAAAVWAGGLAWVVAVAPRERRAEALGAAIGAAIAGALGGPLLGAAADEFGRGVIFAVFVALPAGLIVALARLEGPPSIATPGLAVLKTAARDPRMRRGILLMALPSVGFGLINVLVPLRLDELGAGAVAIAAVFLVAVGLEAVMSPIAGRLADRRGPLVPARLGLISGGIGIVLVPFPDTVVLAGITVIVAASLFGLLWAPAISIVGDGAEEKNMNPAFGFALANMAWGAGTAVGGSGGGALAQVTTDTVPYLVLAAAAMITAVSMRRLTTAAPSPRRPIRHP